MVPPKEAMMAAVGLSLTPVMVISTSRVTLPPRATATAVKVSVNESPWLSMSTASPGVLFSV